MGGSLSRIPFVGKRGVQSMIDKAGLPLQVDGEVNKAALQNPDLPPPPTVTEQYDAPGYFTGLRASVIVRRPSMVVYNSLRTDLHEIFSPITECHDEVEEQESDLAERLFRVVRIPFKMSIVAGNLKLRLQVDQSPKTGEIHFKNLKQGRLISDFVADFKLVPPPDSAQDSEETTVTLDTKISCKSLPPPPFKGLVKGVMVNKIDICMADLIRFHGGDPGTRKSMSKRFGKSWRGNQNRRVSMDSATSLDKPKHVLED